ncbi:MAG TPA: zinc-binding dehydrogenase [Saprospiraceae bacterium]|nr:zinc-binding dehydrogenase [Saprospiraceae bacterium]
MKALLLETVGQPVSYKSFDLPDSPPEWQKIRLTHSALNLRDIWMTKGLYPRIKLPCVLGSDGCGIREGERVVINPGIEWGSNQNFPSKNFTILGMPHHGTFAQQVIVPAKNIYPCPLHLTSTEAAALPLAGLTAYRALFVKCKVQEDEAVLITGIGGGVALAAFRFALVMKCRVYISSSSEDKINRAIAMGAAGGVNYNHPDWGKELIRISGGIDIVIDGAGGDGMSEVLASCNYGARICVYGGTAGMMTKIKPQPIFWKQIAILGSSMGSDQDFTNMLEFVQQKNIRPVIDDVIPLEEGLRGFEKMEMGRQFGKIIFEHPQG